MSRKGSSKSSLSKKSSSSSNPPSESESNESSSSEEEVKIVMQADEELNKAKTLTNKTTLKKNVPVKIKEHVTSEELIKSVKISTDVKVTPIETEQSSADFFGSEKGESVKEDIDLIAKKIQEKKELADKK